MKIKSMTTLTVLLACGILATGCSSQNNSTGSNTKKTPISSVSHKKNSKQASANVKKTTSSTKKSTAIWDDNKDKQLENFIDQWAPTMHQTYTKYDGTNSIKTSVGMTYPDDLSRVNVEGTNDSIGWSKAGENKYSYNVVAIYNYDGTKPPLPNHITYFFTFHKGQPIVLVDQSRDGTPNLMETKNTKVKDSFADIVDGNYKENSTTTSTTAKSAATVKDPKMIGVMVRELARPGDDLTKEAELGVYIHGGKYWIGTGTSVSNVGYTIEGDTVHYFVKDASTGESTYKQPLIEYTISLSQLEAQYYSTAEQKQTVQSVSDSMPDIENPND